MSHIQVCQGFKSIINHGVRLRLSSFKLKHSCLSITQLPWRCCCNFMRRFGATTWVLRHLHRQKTSSARQDSESNFGSAEEFEGVGIQEDSATYASWLRQCGDLRALPEGKRVHECIAKSRYREDVFLGNLLVQMYGKCGNLDDACAAFQCMRERNIFSWTIMLAAYAQNGHLQAARNIFEEMPRRNVVSWNAMIAAYAQNGHGKDALELFRSMDLDGTKPNKVTFVSIFDACASVEALAEGMGIHDELVTNCSGFERDVVVGTALVNMYGKCGCLEEAERVFSKMSDRNVVSWTVMTLAYAQNGYLHDARRVFEQIPNRNVVSWNVMIAAYAQSGFGKEAIQLLQEMDYEGLKPDKISLLSILAGIASLAEARIVHAFIISSGFESDVIVNNALLSMYGKCSSTGDSLRVFQKMHSRDVISWNAVIAAYAQNGHLQHARCVFDTMPEQDVVSWNAVIKAYAQGGHTSEALELFQRLQHDGLRPDKFTLVYGLEACANAKALQLGKLIHAGVTNAGSALDTVVGNTLLKMYGKCNSLEDARQVFEKMAPRDVISWTGMIEAFAQEAKLEEAKAVFDKMPHRDVIAWNEMIAGYTQNGHANEALELFERMEMEGVKPDKVVFLSCLHACANAKSLAKAKAIHARIVKHGLESDVVVGTAMIDTYGKCGNLEDAKLLFEKMPELNMFSWTAMVAAYGINGQLHTARSLFEQIPRRNVVAWNAMIAAYAQNGYGKEALDIFHRMELQGDATANNVTFVSILSACSHAGLFDDGLQFFAAMQKDYGVERRVHHFLCIIDLLSRAGRIGDAEELISQMPYAPGDVAWMTLLAACRAHGNVEQGTRVVENLLDLKPEVGASYVLLSNTYAAGPAG